MVLVDWREWRSTVPEREETEMREGLEGQKEVEKAQLDVGETCRFVTTFHQSLLLYFAPLKAKKAERNTNAPQQRPPHSQHSTPPSSRPSRCSPPNPHPRHTTRPQGRPSHAP